MVWWIYLLILFLGIVVIVKLVKGTVKIALYIFVFFVVLSLISSFFGEGNFVTESATGVKNKAVGFAAKFFDDQKEKVKDYADEKVDEKINGIKEKI